MPHETTRIDPLVVLPASMEEQSRRELTRILQNVIQQINKAAVVAFGEEPSTASFVVGHDVELVDATAGTVTAFLPPADSWSDRIVHVKKVSSNTNTVIVQTQSGETVDGAASKTISVQFAVMRLASDGANWHVL